MAEKTKKKDFVTIMGMKIKHDYLLGFGLLLTTAAYIASHVILFGILSLIILVVLFLKDILPSSNDTKGIKDSVSDLVVALAVALGAWFLLGFLLNTSTPINVVTSCSMLPILDRGDLIILQGSQIRTRTIEINHSISPQDFVSEPCKLREIATGNERQETCIVGLKVDGNVQLFDKFGDIVVYEPKNSLRNIGPVVHRAVLRIKYKGIDNYVIKGDNNPSPDLFGISESFATEEDILGKVIFRAPYLGYLKLFLSMQFEEPNNCKYLFK